MMRKRFWLRVSMERPARPWGSCSSRTQGEEHDADDDHGCAQQKAEQDARGDGGDAETEDQHDGRDGQDGLKCLQQLFPELGEMI